MNKTITQDILIKKPGKKGMVPATKTTEYQLETPAAKLIKEGTKLLINGKEDEVAYAQGRTYSFIGQSFTGYVGIALLKKMGAMVIINKEETINV